LTCRRGRNLNVNDEQTRVKTIEDWVDKIISYVNSEENQTLKFITWMKEIYPDQFVDQSEFK